MEEIPPSQIGVKLCPLKIISDIFCINLFSQFTLKYSNDMFKTSKKIYIKINILI